MKIINQSYDIVRFFPKEDVAAICEGYCICYGHPFPETFEDQCDFIKKHRIHESPLEHSSMTVRFITNRGISHEIVRHRHTGYSQESTRYCNYSKGRFGTELTFINDTHIVKDASAYEAWLKYRQDNEDEYFNMLKRGLRAEEARGCLPNDLKTKLLVTTNFREWRSIFKLRCDSHAHYQMQELMKPLFDEVNTALPCIFDDIKF